MPLNEQDGHEASIERALEWFAEIADLPAAEQRQHLARIEQDDVRASVEEMLAGDRSADARLERCMIAVAALHEHASSETRTVDDAVLRFVLDRVRREARACGSEWTPSESLAATIRNLLHDPELGASEQRGLQQPDLRRGTDSIAALIALRTEASLALALAEARDARAVADVPSTSIVVLRDDVDTAELDLGPFVAAVRQHLDEREPCSERLVLLAEPGAFATLHTQLRMRRVDAPEALTFHSAVDVASGKWLGRSIANVEVLQLDSSCQAIEDRIFGLSIAPHEPAEGIVDPWVGRLLHDKYRILDVIGAGGFGTVYAARDERGAGNIVAIKIMKPHVAERPHLLQAFKNEARRATRLNHPNIVDWKVFDETADGVQYFVMERLIGEELADLLEREGRLAPERASRILLGITEALCAAHHLGADESILHLDLKPANIFVLPPEVARAERVKVLDFGIGQYVGAADGETAALADFAQHASEDGQAATTVPHRTSLWFRGLEGLPSPIDDQGRPFHRSTACTPEYASPEHCEHVLGYERIVPLDGRSDLFALGVLAFQMLTGELPFAGGSVRTDLIRMHAEEPARKIGTTGVALPKRLARFVDRCLERDRDQRFRNAPEALEELRSIVQRPRRKLAWIAAAAAIVVGLLSVGLASNGFARKPPRVELLDGERRLVPGQELFVGPARDVVSVRPVPPPTDGFVARELAVSVRGAAPPTFSAHWSRARSVELRVEAGPDAGWSGALELEDPLGRVAFAPIDVVWIGSRAWSLGQVSLDGQLQGAGSELWLGPDCKHLSVRVGGPELIGRSGLIESVLLRRVGAPAAQVELARDADDPRAFEAELAKLRPGEAWTLDARDHAGRSETLSTLVVVAPLELSVDGFFELAADGQPRRFDEDSNGLQQLFPTPHPYLAARVRRVGSEQTIDAELTWTLRAEPDGTPLQKGQGRIAAEPFPIPLPIDQLRAGTTYVLECNVSDDRVAHGEQQAQDAQMARFHWEPVDPRPRAHLAQVELEPGSANHTPTRRPVLAVEATGGHGWHSTWALDALPAEAFVLAPDRPRWSRELALETEGRCELTLTHRRMTARGIVSSRVLRDRFELFVDTRAPRIVELGIGDGAVFEEPTEVLQVPLELQDEAPLADALQLRYGWRRAEGAAAVDYAEWMPWKTGASLLPLPVPWSNVDGDGTWELRLQARDAARNVGELAVGVHAALRPPQLAFEVPTLIAGPWPSDLHGDRTVVVRATDPNGVDSVVVQLAGNLPDGELAHTVALVDAGHDRWTADVRLGHAWSGAALTLTATATDAYGRTSAPISATEQRLPAIAPPVAIEGQRGDARVGRMRLVAGNHVGPYVFMGRDRQTETATLERALGTLANTRGAGRRDPYWRIAFDQGAIEDFYLDEHEVSVGQFLRFVLDEDGYRHGAHWPEPDLPDDGRRAAWAERLGSLAPDLPVTEVTWPEAHAYANWAGKRLPSWVEWEYAARGGQRYRAFAAEGVASFSTPGELAECLNVRWDGEGRGVRAVGSGDDRTADTGLHDLTGNVREWTSTPCPAAALRPRDHAVEFPELQLRPDRRADWNRQPDYWCAGSCYASRRVEFNTLLRQPRNESDATLGFRCALSVGAYRVGRLSRAPRGTTFEPVER